MSSIRRFHPENRLAKIIRLPGGVTMEEALNRANKGLDSVRGACVTALDSKIAAMEMLMAQCGAALDETSASALYHLSNEVFSEAGTFALAELSQAAHSLCDLIEHGRPAKAWDIRSIEVHLNAMRLLRRAELGEDGAARQAVLQGLRKVSAKAAAV